MFGWNLLILVFLQLVHCQDIITTIAGTGSGSFTGDGGQATAATFNCPPKVALDSLGISIDLYSLVKFYNNLFHVVR